ncbi:hypothetical protein HY468_05860 [Candidatus Roizmanbacteria bacterium]|nr:hypothetical protein [Candidatus Roizmanbacteria bacterium]
MNKVLPVILWIPASFFTVAFAIFFVVHQSTRIQIANSGKSPETLLAEQAFAQSSSKPTVLGTFTANIIALDARPKIIERFLDSYQCPLVVPHDKFASYFVETADRYNLDFRLLPAIAMQESSCCKRLPEGSNNCWGYGIYGDKVVRFSSPKQGMEIVAETLSADYSTKGLLEPDEIMKKYTPPSRGHWALGVLSFMNEMK